jgi:hypothetical protein
MRSFLDSGRKRKRRHGERFRGRFARGEEAGRGGRQLIRFRRNREILAREFVALLLWTGIAVMLMILARTFVRVADAHLSDAGIAAKLGLPMLPFAASIGSLWRARNAGIEWNEVRLEQKEIVASLKERDLDAGDDAQDS